MKLADKIDRNLIRLDFAASGKNDALRRIAAIAAQSPILASLGEEKIFNLLAEREAAVSTGLGNGIAIPHARVAGLSEFVVIVLVSPRGVEFEALDRRKVQLFFVVFAPEERVNDQIKILAAISRAMARGAVRKEMLRTTSPQVVHEIVARASDDAAAAAADGGRQKLLCLILYYQADLQAILEFLIDHGIEGATVIESKGMGAYVSAMPLFASFLGFMRDDRSASSTVITLVPADREKTIVEGIERITGDLGKKQGAMIITLDVSYHKGTMDMI